MSEPVNDDVLTYAEFRECQYERERRFLSDVLEIQCGGSVLRLSERLQCNRTYLYARLVRLGMRGTWFKPRHYGNWGDLDNDERDDDRKHGSGSQKAVSRAR